MNNLQVQENSAEGALEIGCKGPKRAAKIHPGACLRVRELHEGTDRAMAEAVALKDQS